MCILYLRIRILYAWNNVGVGGGNFTAENSNIDRVPAQFFLNVSYDIDFKKTVKKVVFDRGCRNIRNIMGVPVCLSV